MSGHQHKGQKYITTIKRPNEMNRLIIKSVIALLFITLLVSGCGSIKDPNQPDTNDGGDKNEQDSGNIEPDESKPDESEDDDELPADPDADIKAEIQMMTLDEKIGQMFIIGFEGAEITKELQDMLETRAPGGVILFRSNVKNPEQLLELVNSIKITNSGRVPLFVSVDEEGGRVSRMPEVLSDIPSAAAVGEYGDIKVTYDIGTLLAEEISSFGFNMDFAPVLDIMSNPDNTVIGDRSFGITAQIVTEHGIELMRGIRDKGVVPVVKHFPGHGDTLADSHKELPVVEHDMSRLASFELVPFQKAVDENADAVMVAHLIMKTIDPKNPATMSKAVITDLLRDQMGFDGVVMTDDMTMGAIVKNYDIGDAAVSSVVAGSDMILVCHGYDKQSEAIDAVRSAVETGFIDETRIDESVFRILRLKAKYMLEDGNIDSIDTDGLNKKIDGQLAKWYNR